MTWDRLYQEHHQQMEDFWGRRESAPAYRTEITIFGRPVIMESNEPAPLAAARYSTPLFSTLPASGHEPFHIQFVVREPRVDPGPPPADLMNRIWYSGDASWLMIQAADWGHGYVDLARARAKIVLAPAFAAQPELLSRCLLNTVLLNFCLASGFGMLHASCLKKDGRVIMLMAPHNTGKSTTALRLLDAGFQFITDSMIHVVPGVGSPVLVAFPIGISKLRTDMLDHFPHLRSLLEAEPVRNETKFRLDMRRLDESVFISHGLAPRRVELCLLARHNADHTVLKPAHLDEVWSAIMANSLYLDSKAVWERNLAQVARLLAIANCHHVIVGEDPADIVSTFEQLCSLD